MDKFLDFVGEKHQQTFGNTDQDNTQEKADDNDEFRMETKDDVANVDNRENAVDDGGDVEVFEENGNLFYLCV